MSIVHLMPGSAALEILMDRAHDAALEPANDRDIREDRSRRRQAKAQREEVSVSAHAVAHGDRWWPTWDAKDRAWLPKEGMG